MVRGRGTDSNMPGRYARQHHEAYEDGWPGSAPEEESAPTTECTPERARSIIARNQSPDVLFEQSINPYRGCEHGCIYCYARPSHAWLDLSPGLDFETSLRYKANAAECLQRELAHPDYRCRTIVLGANTDPYQPVERRLRVTRSVLETLHACHHPVSIITKGRGILRDRDLLADLARQNLVSVMVSLTSLDTPLKRALEPRAASPQGRLDVIRTLAADGVPVGTLIAPVIPGLTDHELERLVAAAAEAGAGSAGYILLRLPWEVRPLFREWLERHFPQRAEHVMSLVRQCRGGRENDSTFGTRMRGSGVFAELLRQRFAVALRRHAIGGRGAVALATDLFQPPQPAGTQLRLFPA